MIETSLTTREVEVLRLASKGLTNTEIGEQLNIDTKTVAAHLLNINNKLHTQNRTEAVMSALRMGLITV